MTVRKFPFWTLLVVGWLMAMPVPAQEPIDEDEAAEASEAESESELEPDQDTAAERTSPQERESVRLYRNPEERREAGLGTALTDWLKFSGLVELEKESHRLQFADQPDRNEYGRLSRDVQLGLMVEAFDWLEAELIYEVEYGRTLTDHLDEAMIGADFAGAGIQLGRLYVPFGEYFSHLASGPALEFGETRADALVLDYELVDGVDLNAFVYEGRIDTIGRHGQRDWGYWLELQSEDESLRLGLGYTSDLAEATESLLGETTRQMQQRVSGWSAYLLWGFAAFELTVETVQAQRAFRELDPAFDQPVSHNVELAYFPQEQLQCALRIERNRELEDEPEWRYGVGLSAVLADRLLISLDYLYSDFDRRGNADPDDELQTSQHTVVLQLGLEF